MRLLASAAALAFALAPLGAGAQGVSLQRVSGKKIALLAQREVAALPHDADRDFVAVTTVPDQLLGAGRIDLHPQAPVGTSAYVNVPVEIDLDGRPERTVMVGYRIAQFVETAVAAHDLVPGTVLTEDDVTIGRVPYTGVAPNGIDALIGRKIDEPLVKGRPVTIQDTTVNQIVTPGSTVVFIVRDSGVAVTADVVARTGGGMGDQVFVYNPLTHKALSGTVTAPGTVELDISGGDR